MTTKDDFLARQSAANCEKERFYKIWIPIFFALLFGNVAIAAWIDSHKPAIWIQAVYGCLLFGFIVGNLVLLVMVGKRRIRKYGLVCPACDKPLVRRVGQFVVATGKCGHCGDTIFQA
jgi:hypothetical protein